MISPAQQVVDDCYAKVSAKWGDIPRPTVSWTLKHSTAGRANYTRNALEFHPVLYVENKERYLQTTVVHECAHLLAYAVYGATGHGKHWQYMMDFLGAPVKRCHSYDTSNVKKRVYARVKVYCDCTTHNFTRVRLNKMAQGINYSCRLCGTRIRDYK